MLARVIGVGFLLLVPALAAFLSGQPFIFPSLGPSAFNLVQNDPRENTARKVIGGHLIGLVCGLISYKIFAPGLSLTHVYSGHPAGMLGLSLSGLVSVMLTTAAMMFTRSEHSPACATTLIVSLGLLSTPEDCFLIMVSVICMFAVYKILYYALKEGEK